jgi:uncharacterized protein
VKKENSKKLLYTMKRALLYLIILVFLSCNKNSDSLSDYPIAAVNITKVKLTDNFWLPKIKVIQNATIQYAFNKCYTEGRIDNFLIAGGKMEGTTRGAMPFDDTDLYKIIEGASYSLVSAPDPELDAYLDSLIAIIKTGQEEDGYLTTWKTIDYEHPPAPWVKPGGRWQNLGASHELYNSGHLYEAASAHYYATGKRNFLDIALKNADLLVKTFGPGKLQAVPGHQIVETGLIKLYRITHKREYLELARYFLDERGKADGRELFGPYSQDHKPVTEQDEVVGHAVRAVYMYAGMTDIAAIYNDTAYLKAVNALWENMVTKKMYLTGGIGSRHEGEAFGGNYELPNLTAYNETCAAIGDVYWNQRLFLLTGDSKYYDVIERTLYNGLIAGLSLQGTEFFYPNPLEADGVYKFNQGACTRQAWFDCSCCPTNLIRFVPSIPGTIYATQKDSIYINLYMSNSASITLQNNKVEIVQETDYPWEGNVHITVNPEEKATFTLKLRIPGWSRNQVLPGDLYAYLDTPVKNYIIRINNKEYEGELKNGYFDITRKWSAGDQVELILPLEIRRVIANENVADDKGKVAIECGPLVYCAEEIDNDNKVLQLSVPDKVEFHFGRNEGFPDGVHPIIGDIRMKREDYKLTLIPYYAWSNRGVGKMQVWFPRIK